MATKAASDFILRITEYFHGHWEDPEWGKLPVNQLLIGLAIRELSSRLQDPEVRNVIHTAADRTIAKNGQSMAKG